MNISSLSVELVHSRCLFAPQTRPTLKDKAAKGKAPHLRQGFAARETANRMEDSVSIGWGH